MEEDILGAGIIYRRKRQIQFLLIQDRFNKWTFPKGKISTGEDLQTAALRESSEETGLKRLKIKKYLGKIQYKVDQRDKNVYFYLIESFDDKKKLFVYPNKERIKQVVWKTPLDIKKLLGYNNFIPCFDKALKYLKI